MPAIAKAPATLSAEDFHEIKGRLRLDLTRLQQRNRLKADFPIIVLLSGVRGAGIIDTLNLLNNWMDPRWIRSHAFDPVTEPERRLPAFRRFWRTLPAAGAMGLYLGGWYADPIADYCGKRITKAGLTRALRHIAATEETWAANGALVLKFWLHLDKATHAATRHVHATDPVFGFRSSDAAWLQPPDYDSYVKTAETAIKATDQSSSRWHVVDGRDDNYRRATVLTTLRDALERHFKEWRASQKAAAKKIKLTKKAARKRLKNPPKGKTRGRLDRVDLSKTVTAARYRRAFLAAQERLYAAHQAAHAAGVSTTVVLEGWDAAGKGGAVRRLTYGLNARHYAVVPVAAPNDEERAHHYLWRFWRALDDSGHVTIFDRSWYGRVLIERVDNLIPEDAWRRAYDEINDFEEQLTSRGDTLIKFWLHIDRDTQAKRFKERMDTAYKRWKLTQDDWHNRGRWPLYRDAAEDMFRYTSSRRAPWHIVPANDKRFARLFVLETVAAAMEKATARRLQPPSKQRSR